MNVLTQTDRGGEWSKLLDELRQAKLEARHLKTVDKRNQASLDNFCRLTQDK